MNTRIIPSSFPALISLGGRALGGVQRLGETLRVAQNTAPRVATDLHDFVGEPGPTPVIRGKEAEWQAKRDALTAARATHRAVIADAREFWSDAVDLLKLHLGRTWNPAWQAVGFSNFSLATSRGNPIAMLLRIRAYLRDHPTRENAPVGITVAQADTHIAAIRAGEQAVDAAIAASKLAAAARKASAKRLRQRLKGLREELNQLLDPADMRWYEFGFSRPGDGRAPAAVRELTATPAGPGAVLISHAPSARAVDYRVSWKVRDASDEPTEAGLFADLGVPLTGLPRGAAIVVSVTARNTAGETPPSEVTVVVP